MKQRIKFVLDWLNAHSKAKEWMWFVFLWLGGMLSFLVLAYPIKLLIKCL